MRIKLSQLKRMIAEETARRHTEGRSPAPRRRGPSFGKSVKMSDAAVAPEAVEVIVSTEESLKSMMALLKQLMKMMSGDEDATMAFIAAHDLEEAVRKLMMRTDL